MPYIDLIKKLRSNPPLHHHLLFTKLSKLNSILFSCHTSDTDPMSDSSFLDTLADLYLLIDTLTIDESFERIVERRKIELGREIQC